MLTLWWRLIVKKVTRIGFRFCSRIFRDFESILFKPKVKRRATADTNSTTIYIVAKYTHLTLLPRTNWARTLIILCHGSCMWQLTTPGHRLKLFMVIIRSNNDRGDMSNHAWFYMNKGVMPANFYCRLSLWFKRTLYIRESYNWNTNYNVTYIAVTVAKYFKQKHFNTNNSTKLDCLNNTIYYK